MCVPVDSSSMKQVLLFLMRFGWSGACLTMTTDKKVLIVLLVFRIVVSWKPMLRQSLDRCDAKDIPVVDLLKLSSQVTTEEFSGESMARLRVARGLPAFKM